MVLYVSFQCTTAEDADVRRTSYDEWSESQRRRCLRREDRNYNREDRNYNRKDEMVNFWYRCSIATSLLTLSHLLTEVDDARFEAVPQERLQHDPRRLMQVNYFVVISHADFAVRQ